jgi:hypothetical protein
MNRIKFPLQPQSQGDAVADLQEGLQLLLKKQVLQVTGTAPAGLEDRLRVEQTQRVYGQSTRLLVSVFQQSRGLPSTGAVDEPTAKTLNTVLAGLGAFEAAAVPVEATRVVAGQVRREDGRPLAGTTVRAVHLAERDAIRLGDDLTDQDGRYAVRYQMLPGVAAITLQVSAVDPQGSLLAQARLAEPAQALQILDLVVPADADSPTWRVSGRVTSRASASTGGLRVRIVDKMVGGDVPLADALTDDDGKYDATFLGTALSKSGKTYPDLQARVFAGDQFVGGSEVRYNASPRERLNVVLADTAAPALRSEHDTVTAAVARHFKGKLTDLKEDDERSDLTYLANKTGWDARAVALASLAAQFSARTVRPGDAGLEAPLFYAMFRAGLPANESAIYRTDSKTIRAVWTKAIAQGVIAPLSDDALKAAVDRFGALAAQRTLDAPALVGVSSLKELLSISLASPTQQQRFAELYTRHRTDMPRFWKAVTDAFGEPVTRRLQLDGQLAYLTLNNGPLIRKVQSAAGANGLSDAAQLVDQGYHRSERWQAVVGNDKVPREIPGANDQERRQRYVDVLAAQVRLSFPTRVVAQMVRSGETPVQSRAAGGVHEFLVKNQGKFEIGLQPVKQYIGRNNLQVAPEVLDEITRIQRVYQITPGDTAMNVLLQDGLDSASAVARYDRNEFVRKFGKRVGGDTNARLIHSKSQQVHNAVLNIALSYLTAANAPGIGAHSLPQIINPAPGPNPNATDVIAYGTLENLFGSMDFCSCDHCRSILSPAAYLVDLLLFCDRQDNELESPLTVLLERRPDLQHLPLTCENTNTPLPYIDVVNETLEYYITNGLSLANYEGHTFDGSARPEELLANPQFVTDAAYTTLAGKPLAPADPPPLLPPTPPLPFHQPLEKLRRYVAKFETSLSNVMEVLRATDALERPAPADPTHPVEYGWRDILMEDLRLSRAEHELITDRTRALRQLYGFPATATQPQVLVSLSNAAAFAARVEISYVDLVEILRTRFVNPGSSLLPRLERLGVSFGTIKAFKDGTITPAQFDEALAPGLDASAYGGDIQGWVTNQANYDTIMGLITLTDPTGTAPEGTFDTMEFRYANPDMTANQLRAFEFVRLYRFIRLWQKLGWTIDQTDRAITALYPPAQTPDDASDAVNLQRLDAGFRTMLPRLAVVRRMSTALNLKLKKDLPSQLACFAPIDTHGDASLYRQMFLSPARLDQDAAFADDGFGNVLTGGQMLLAHAPALRAAFSLTDEEFTLITEALGFDGTTPLTLGNISAVFRRGWLARKLKVSVRELLLLVRFTGIDPFAAPDPVDPPTLRFLDLVSRLKALSFKPAQALYLIWNEDISGRSAPRDEDITTFARTLRAELAAIAREFAVREDPDGQIAPARMALVYGGEATDVFFGLLNQSVVTDVSYAHAQPTLEQEIVDAAQEKLTYDDLRKRLAYTGGVMPDAIRNGLTGLAGVTGAFVDAVNALHAKTHAFFVRYPELEPLHDAFVTSTDTPEEKRATLLAALLPQLEDQRKRQHTLQALGAAVEVDIEFATSLADDPEVLHATSDLARPALDDVRVVETGGLSARWWFANTATSENPADATSDAVATLAYGPGGQALPANPTPGNAISGIWSGYLEAPENGFYNLRIDTDAAATVTLTLDGADVTLAQSGARWSNAAPIELRAGTLHAIDLTVDRVTTAMTVWWQTLGRGWEIIPAEFLYSATLTDRLRNVYVRVRKASALAEALKLSAAETAYLAAHPDYAIAADGWLNVLPVEGSPTPLTAAALLTAASAVLEYARLKDALKATEDRLLAVLEDPIAATEAFDSLLFTLTQWEADSLDALLIRFGFVQGPNAERGALGDLSTFARVFDAYAWVRRLRVPAAALIAAATNEPDAALVRDFQGALRARYEEQDWLETLKPINDEIRALQRDALVAYILHQMRAAPATAHIDTSEKLFEYFLMDVQMQPCMQTSRIRHALSSAQLFIERCVMNLEPRVAATSINATQWAWMRRYRVWEANRKVFLFPENWLEPELRDDKSVFFTETMSELLQSDITDDAAAKALLNYLSKLEEVAKLEPCAIHYAEYDGSKAEDDIAYVIARTCGARRKYFYRRREFGYWTPWEPIQLDIENDPVLPVLWKNRLLLFWLKIIQQTPLQTPAAPTGDLDDLDAASTINSNSRISVKAMLCWSEYYNGKWQPAKTSDPNEPALLGTFVASGSGAFNRSALRLSVTDMESTLTITISGQGYSTYTLYNTHSLPEPNVSSMIILSMGPTRTLNTAGNTLSATYERGILFVPLGETPPESTLPRPILTTGIRDRVVEPKHPLQDTWDAPFFYEDGRHVFYVSTRQRLVSVPHWGGFDFEPPVFEQPWEIPHLVFETPPIPDPIGPIVNPPDFAVINPAEMTRFVTEDAYIRRGFEATKPVQFGTTPIGPGGKVVGGPMQR